MKKVVWGTGYNASKFMATHNAEEIEFFIDSDISKEDKVFLGKRIVHPDRIQNWKELYVFVPYTFYEEISKKLENLGLKEFVNYTKYLRGGFITEDEAVSDYQRAVSEVIEQKENMYGKYLFWGHSWGGNKGIKKILLPLQRYGENVQFALVSEDVWFDRENTEAEAEISSIVAPKIFDEDIYISGTQECTKEMECFYNEIEFQDRIDQIEGTFPENVNASMMVYYMYKYIYKVIDEIKPKGIFAHASIQTFRKILRSICKERGIPIIYTHVGILPGTFSCDIGGEMGESLPALYPEMFKKLPVSKGELSQAKKVWIYLETSRLNRKMQPKNHCVDYIMKKIKRGRPIVFLAGQNDVGSHMVPYTGYTKKYHSPIFVSSLESVAYLADLCEKNNWNFVYKPHPNYIRKDTESLLPANTIYVETGDINDIVDISDVVVTILSQTNYVSLIRHKPVVMLGYNQTKGKGCTYEAFEKDKIEDTVREALEKGFTAEQEKAFLKHIAQVLKYYLFDDLQERELRFGRKVPSSVEEFYELEKLLKESDENT